ncbi:MAG: D-serine ammonia-lyase [Tabrizicola sp.]|nr:D-serine ammonia-lyase [Tabrizicola sp.]
MPISSAEKAIRAGEPVFWLNDDLSDSDNSGLSDKIKAAGDRMTRFAPLLSRAFPALVDTGGLVTSPLLDASRLARALNLPKIEGRLMLKGDHELTIGGSIKARGGTHAVLAFAEQVLAKAGHPPDTVPFLNLARVRAVLAGRTISVGSTGNLGLSVGMVAVALGFRAEIHMSVDARSWKKDRLRSLGVNVIEHAGNYEAALAAGRADAEISETHHFIDDEDSEDLLFGYSVAAAELRDQLQAGGVTVDSSHPLFVYLPCGVGGAPVGVTVGLKAIFGRDVHCFFAEPVEAPCMLVHFLKPGASVHDFGLSGRTEADGLAVPRASVLAANLVRGHLSGIFTIADDTLFRHLHAANRDCGFRLEPSAAASFDGPSHLLDAAGCDYLAARALTSRMGDATHIFWATGGSQVPQADFESYYAKGEQLRS